MPRQYAHTSDGNMPIDFADFPKGREYFDNQDSGKAEQPQGIKDLFLMLKKKIEELEDGKTVCIKIVRSDEGRSWEKIQSLLDKAK